VTYRRPLRFALRAELVVEMHVLNLFNAVGVRFPETHAITRTAFTDPALQPFDPQSETPVQGVHWILDETNVRATTADSATGRTMGRAFRLSLGVRY
jgi:hypothetical protein